MIKVFYIVIILMVGLFVGSLFCHGATGNVKDDNNGSNGDILIHSRTIKGKNNDVGTWTNPNDLSFKDNIARDNITKNSNLLSNHSNILDSHSSTLSNHEDRLNNHEDRIDELEETQVNIAPELVLLQGRRHKIGVYGKYDTLHNRVPEVGLRISIALDDSWETKEIEKLNKRFEALEAKLNRHSIETEVIKTGESSFRIQIKDKKDADKFLNNIK